MENKVDNRSTSFYILRFVKVSRIIFFGSSIGILAYFTLSSGIVDYLSSIAGPCFIIIMDLLMFNRSRNHFKEFYLVSIIICLMALGITMVTLLPLMLFLYISNFIVALFYLIGLGVMGVSFIELFTLIYLTRPQEDYSEPVWEEKDEVWDKKKDTIDIQ